MKFLGVVAVTAVFAIAVPAMANDIVVGSPNGANCFPWFCNESGTDDGLTADAQEVYSSTLFSGPTTILSISAYFDTVDGGTAIELGGFYNIYIGYAAHGSVNNLSPNLASNWLLTPVNIINYTITDGFLNDNPLGVLPLGFYYDPSIGDLMIETVAFNQPNAPSPNGRGYFVTDDSGSVVSRAYCIPNVGCDADGIGLVNMLQTTGTVDAPEPATLFIFGAGLLSLRRWKKIV